MPFKGELNFKREVLHSVPLPTVLVQAVTF